MSEELENSLQQAVETYLNDRLRTIDEQVSRLQSEVTEALARLRESSSAQNLDETPLSAAIFAHLQTARGQKLSGSETSSAAPGDARTIKRAVEDIEQQQTQTDVLKSLLTCAVQFAERVALFVIKADQAIGWRLCEAGDPTNLELIGGASLPLSADTTVTRAIRARALTTGAPQSNDDDRMLIDQLGGNPASISAVPLIVRGKAVAVLYADSESPDPEAINSDALEVLTRVAAMAVNLVSMQRAAAPAQEDTAAKPTETPEKASEPEPTPEPPTYQPVIEAQVAEAEPPVVTAEVPVVAPEPEPPAITAEMPAVAEQIEPTSIVPEVPIVAAEAEAPAAEAGAGTEEAIAQPTSEATDVETGTLVESVAQAPEPETVAAEVAPEGSVPETPTEPAPFVSQYATPLGGSRRFGVNEPDLPVEVSEEERRLHNDARRFARLLVSEIKLYNEPKVLEGRSNSDLYERLREDIDRSRQMYDKRVAPPVAARHDYFHQELVNTLAEGDPAKLGSSYPGAAVSVA